MTDGRLVSNESNRICGNCCWFKHEDANGFGVCYKCNEPHGGVFGCMHRCHKKGIFVSHFDYDRYTLDLQQYIDRENGKDVDPIDPERLKDAIAFAVKYLKTF